VATPENEEYLLYIAHYGTASHVEQVVRKYRKVKQVDDSVAEGEQERKKDLVYYQDSDGMWIIHAKLPAEAGSLVVKAIEAVATPEQEKKQAEIPEKDSADSFSEEVEQQEPVLFRELLSHTRADALVSISEHFLATSGHDEQFLGLKGSERCQVVLHVDINTLRESAKPCSATHEHCNLDEKHWVSPKTAKRLSCDASLVTVLEDEKGKVLNIGRRSRTVPGNISRALNLRDQTCRFPGCCESRYVDAHHIKHWADGGETSLDNLVTLCRYHHRQLHQGGFNITVEKSDEEQQLVFFTPSGRKIESSFFPQFQSDSAETFPQTIEALAPAVDSSTCITRWTGEDCDYGMAIDGLLIRDGR
jgi:hypothetical protein